jgi:hypothetical protein
LGTALWEFLTVTGCPLTPTTWPRPFLSHQARAGCAASTPVGPGRSSSIQPVWLPARLRFSNFGAHFGVCTSPTQPRVFPRVLPCCFLTPECRLPWFLEGNLALCCRSPAMTLAASREHFLAARVDAFWSAVNVAALCERRICDDNLLKYNCLIAPWSQLNLLALRLHPKPVWFGRRGRDGETVSLRAAGPTSKGVHSEENE